MATRAAPGCIERAARGILARKYRPTKHSHAIGRGVLLQEASLSVPARASGLRLLGLPGLLGCLCATPVAVADDWLPVTPEELHMTGEPLAPKAPAIYLYRQVDRDDSNFEEFNYVRIKILSDEGLEYASVEIPFVKNTEDIRSIRARTIRPDGAIINFDGTVYEKPIFKTRNVGLLAKAFTLPGAEVGCIIEYRYTHRLSFGWVFDSHWILSQELFTKHAKFSLNRNTHFTLVWSWPQGLPPGTEAPKDESGRIRLETHDVPAFVTEEHMPPENEQRVRVDFIYDAEQIPRINPAAYWKQHGKRLYDEVQRFTDERRAMEKALAQVIQATDAPEARLRKLYERTQRIQNLSFESESEQEAGQRNDDSIRSVDDVWSRGYGNARQINWLFLALARTAGIEAYPVLVSTRDRYFFSSTLMNAGELNSALVLVKLDGKELYLEPGVPFTPFGLLPWYETGVEGLRLDKDGGTWLRTPMPDPSASRIEHKASLSFDAGTLSGRVTVTYTGLEASWRRLQERAEDDTARRQFLENDLEGSIPTGVHVKLANSPDWSAWDAPLVAEYELEVPGWATPAGRRLLLPLGLFGAHERHTFEHAIRVHAMYFDYPYLHADEVTIELQPPWVIDAIPKPRTLDLEAVMYKTAAEAQKQSLHITRELTLNAALVNVKYYDSIRGFYDTVRTGDEEQVVLSYGAAKR